MTSGVLMDAVTSGVLMDAGERPGGTGEPAYYRPPITVRGKPRSLIVGLPTLARSAGRSNANNHRLGACTT